MVLDNKFSIAENSISLKSIEALLSSVKCDLLDSLKATPTINLDGNALVLTVRDYSPDDISLSRYFRIIWQMIAGIQSVENE
jgi:hypothetical protein